MRLTPLPFLTLWLVLVGTLAARATDSSAADCLSDDYERRIAGCTVMIENPATTALDRGNALAMRGLALSVKGLFERSIDGYSASLKINPNSEVTLNNRAWAYYRAGRPLDGLADIEEALRLNPHNEHARDTRAHIRLAQGLPEEALGDFLYAFEYGSDRMRKTYECGLVEAGIIPKRGTDRTSEQAKLERNVDQYERRIEIVKGLTKCVKTRGCSPVPKDEKPC